MKRNIIEEIKDAKDRYSLFSTGNLPIKVRQIEEALESIERNGSYHLINFIPVQIVALFQSHFREVIIDLIDKEKISLSEIEALTKTKNIKFDVRTLKALKEEKFTLGELITHLFSFNNINETNQILSTLLKKDFFNELKEFDYQKVNHDNTKNIDNILKDNFGEIIQSLEEVFRLRNIICHEYGFNLNLTIEKIKDLWKNSVLFLSHISIYITTFQDPTPRLSLKELSEKSKKSNIELSKKIDMIVEEIISIEPKNFDKNLFRSSILKWREYVDLKVNATAGNMKNTDLQLFYFIIENLELENKLKELEAFKEQKSNEVSIDENSPHYKLLMEHLQNELN